MKTRNLIILGIGLFVLLIGAAIISNGPLTNSATKPVTEKQLQGEAATGVAQQQQSALSTAQYPILNELPVETPTFKIGSGLSPTHVGNSSYFALYIRADTPAAKAEALKWMTDNGYKPSDYEILYKPYSDF